MIFYFQIPSLPVGEEMRRFGVEISELLKKHHPVINRDHMIGSLKAEYNFRVEQNFLSTQQITEQTDFIFKNQKSAFKINCSFGFILRNIETQRLRYYYAHENDQGFDLPVTVTTTYDLPGLVKRIANIDLIHHVTKNRPSTKWVVFKLCNIRYTVYKLNFTLGAGKFPAFIKNSKCVETLDYNKSTGAPLPDDGTCMFRCLARHFMGTATTNIRNFNCHVQWFFNRWLTAENMTRKEFTGVNLHEIHKLEEMFDVGIHIFESDAEMNLSSIHKPMKKRTNVMYLMSWEHHLCYISNFQQLKQNYKCRSCSKLFKRYWLLKRHETSCTTTQALVFPGKYYKPASTIFERLETVGVNVAKADRFFKHFAVFDFESILEKIVVTELSPTNFTAEHHPISVCVTSNCVYVEGIDFVCNYDTDKLIKGFIDSLENIQTCVSKMYTAKFRKIFEFLDREIENCSDILGETDTDDETAREMFNCETLLEDEIDVPICDDFNEKIKQRNTFRKFLQRMCSIESSDSSDDEAETEPGSQMNPASVTFPTRRITNMNERVTKLYRDKLMSLERDLHAYCNELPVLAFNSQKYDLCIIKDKLAKHLDLPKTQKFVAKRNSAYSCISTSKYKFLDVSNFLAPGYSYSEFLKAYDVDVGKSYFCYEFFDDPAKLELTELPEYKHFYSELKECNVLEEEYSQFTKLKEQMKSEEKAMKAMKLTVPPKTGPEKYAELQQIWKDKNMKTFKDYLEYYNAADVRGFIIAVEKMLEFYFDLEIDLLKTCQSSPGAARTLMFKDLNQTYFSLFSKKNADLYHILKSNCTGGPSIVYHRFHEAGKTEIKNSRKLCQKILGWDCNALYLYCISQIMPSGYMIRRRAENNFRAEKDEKYLAMFHWMDYVAMKKNLKIVHSLNNGGKEVFVPPYRLDGFTAAQNGLKPVAYEFAGCFFHGHEPETCPITAKITDQNWLASQKSKLEALRTKQEYLEKNGYQFVLKWECSYRQMLKTNPELRSFVSQQYDNRYMKHRTEMTQDEILQAVQTESFFGCCEVDLHVPENLCEYFGEMSPIFCTTEVEFDSIGEHMQNFAKSRNISTNPRKLLIGGMKAEKILLATPLLKWYIDHGLKVTKVYQTLEFENNNKCFEKLCNKITHARREGDKHQNKKIIADSMKLIGNSLFGGSLLDRSRYKQFKYVKSKTSAQNFVNDPKFVNLEELDAEIFEFEMQKKRILQDVPVQIGYFILQYAKLFMLQFFYDFLTVFFKPTDYCLMSMDTDSFYVAFASENPFDLVDVSLRMRLCTEWERWFPREYCSKHKSDFIASIMKGDRREFKSCEKCVECFKYDSRQPGLFKVEFEGTKMICLCSKMYCIDNQNVQNSTKLSCKGVNKRRVKDPVNLFEQVIETKQTMSACNKGFISRDNKVFTYDQTRASFTYFYPKRKVLDDGVTTTYLDITLKPLVHSSV